MDTYSYTPLAPESAEIRLLTIEPGLWDADIKCNLQHVFLDNKPSYEALSYTWGDSNDIRQIFLGGHPWNVRANLEVALRYLRHKDEPRIMWIDAVCLNQRDLKERSEQLFKMREIYTSASKVVAWLGPPGEETDAGMEAIEEYATKIEQVDDGVIKEFHLTPEVFLLQAGIDISTMNWRAIWSILERPYWERVWVIQELAACGSGIEGKGIVVCGFKSIPKWMVDSMYILFRLIGNSLAFINKEDLVAAIINKQPIAEPMRTLILKDPSPAYRMTEVLALYYVSADDSADRNLAFMVMEVSSSFKASDPRDKLYALLGLARREDAMAVTPDYSKPLDWIFTDFITSLIRRDRSLACLSFNRRGTNGFGPSWIPDIFGGFERGSSWGRPLSRVADQECDVEFSFDDQRSLLIANGIKVGVLDVVIGPFRTIRSDGASRPKATGSAAASLGIFAPVVQQLAEFIRTLSDSSEHERLWRTLVIDLDISDEINPASPAPQRFGESYMVWVGLADVPADFEPGLPHEAREAKFRRDSGFELNFGQTIMNRCFFRTTCGKMGMGPYYAKPGDVVTALFGASRFLVLRPKELYYELVGDAYVEGGTVGEFLKDADASAERFPLC